MGEVWKKFPKALANYGKRAVFGSLGGTMKKSLKRILCGAMSLMMASSLVAEHWLRSDAEEAVGQSVTAEAAFENVTGQYDTAALRESYFNSGALKTSATEKATYETRTVIVALESECLVDAANGEAVSEFATSWSGMMAQQKIRSAQDAFLRALDKESIPYELERRYDAVLNGVAIEVDTKYVSQMKKISGVESVVIATTYSEPETIATESADVATNATSVYKTGIYDSTGYESYGEGTVVAVLDTGLDYTHEAFQTQPSGAVKFTEDYVEEKLETFELTAEGFSGVTLSDVYLSKKIPFAYDYADKDADVYPSYSNHGTHVAGIVAGYNEGGYTNKDGEHVAETFTGVASEAQLVICKVFTDDLDDEDLGGAEAEDIIAALNDCVTLGVDVINMSLGTSCGFSTTDDGDEEGKLLNAVYERIADAGISLMCAASNDYSSGYGSVFGTNLKTNPDSGTIGSPSTFAASMAVASISGQQSDYMIGNAGSANEAYVFYEESRDANSKPFDFAEQILGGKTTETFEYVVVPGIGQYADYTSTISNLLKTKDANGNGRIALIKRGNTTFQEKIETAMEMSKDENGNVALAGVIVYNNVAGLIRMNLGEIDDPCPAVSINLNAGTALVKGAVNNIGKITVDTSNKAGPFMSEFSSWGPTHDLRLKPEITAHGGEITSTVPGGYGEQSGTSMATPNMAGFMAIVRNYIQKDLKVTDPVAVNRLANQLTMSTATMAIDPDGLPYSPRKQGAGLASLENVISKTKAYLSVDNEGNDYRPKFELGDDPEKKGEYTVTFTIHNFGTQELKFKPDYKLMTEKLSIDGLAVAEQAELLDDVAPVWSSDALNGGVLTVAADSEADVTVTFKLSAAEKKYIDDTFKNGMYVEGFVQLDYAGADENQCDLTLPFLGFYGDWEQAPMLDYTAYEIAESEKDKSIDEEEKLKARVWATQPYAMYYNNKYIIPMGSYVYLLPEGDEEMYTDEKYNAISCYNVFNGEDELDNYMSTTGIKAVYAGLLRNARLVKYKLYDVNTGELILEDVCNRVGKAYSGGGSAVPANVEFELDPLVQDLAANGEYRMELEFFMNTPAAGEVAPKENTFDFTFTVDYEAPVLQDVRVRYETYKDGRVEKQRIYLDVDIYDNHYAQTMMLCYPKQDTNGDILLQIATDYPTPIRNANKNGTTTVSLEITDIYTPEWRENLYIQIDDYALNTCLYRLDMSAANSDVLPEGDEFAFAGGESEITLKTYETYKAKLAFDSVKYPKANDSNFVWSSNNPAVANVNNGEIVGLSAGNAVITVSNGKGASKTLNVTVLEEKTALDAPDVSFGVIKNRIDSLTVAEGLVEMYAGKAIDLKVSSDPWFHPLTGYRLLWSVTDEDLAFVSGATYDGTLKKSVLVTEPGQTVTINTLKKGTVSVMAELQNQDSQGNWTTRDSADVTFRIFEEFTVSNYTLTDYNGVGYNGEICGTCGRSWMYDELVTDGTAADTVKDNCPHCKGVVSGGTKILKMPTDMNIMYIGEKAFLDNDNIERIVIAPTVVEIQRRAFENCTALKEVYFVSTLDRDVANAQAGATPIDAADLSLVYEMAFYGCKKLKKVDLSNAKTITLAQMTFADCTALEEIVDMPSIGTMHNLAFSGCTALTEVDLTGLHMSGFGVFSGCTALETVTTGKFTAIGEYMFNGCTGLTSVELNTPKIGAGAFYDCTKLRSVKFRSPAGEQLKFNIGASAFENCASDSRFALSVDFGDETVASIGDNAFRGAKIQSFELPKGLQTLGANVVNNQSVVMRITDDTDFSKITFKGIPFKGLTLDVSESTIYSQASGCIFDKNQTTLHLATAAAAAELDLSSYTFTSVGEYAFAGNETLTKVILPTTVATIGEGAFEGCTRLQTVEFGANTSLTSIPKNAFYGSGLLTITLPTTVTEIGENAFAGSALNAFTAKGILNIGNSAFDDCKSLLSVSLSDADNATGTESVTFGSYIFSGANNLTTVTLPSITQMGEGNFFGLAKLDSVTFGLNATQTGTYTFAESSVKTVTLGEKTNVIDEGAFYGCRQLESVALQGGTIIEIKNGAFANCENLTFNETFHLKQVVTIGNYAFYHCNALEALELNAAEHVGKYAFAIERGSAYTSVQMPVVKTIGESAFQGGAEASVALPVSLKTVGGSAFADSKNLAVFTVETGESAFFVEDGVLYRAIDGGVGYELVAYPAARVQESTDGVKTYEVKAKTVRIHEGAFYGLNDGALDEVVLPYSVKTIGDFAFYHSGIKEYTFESIKAPVLESSYRAEIVNKIENLIAAEASGSPYYKNGAYLSNYKGYYYSNFEEDFVTYTQYGGETSGLKINRPTNGVGYDNLVYTTYFGQSSQLGVLMDDNTRFSIELLESLPTETTIAALAQLPNTAENKALVEQYALEVQEARKAYNNVKDADQLAFVAQNAGDKVELLATLEETLRFVKPLFGITVKIESIKISDTSTHRTEYTVGETFDMTGLQVLITYEDFSTEIADVSKLTLQTGAFTSIYTNQVLVKLDGHTQTLRIPVKVTASTQDSDNTDHSSGGTRDQKTDKVWIWIAVGVVAVVAVAAVTIVMLKLSAKKKAQTSVETEEAQENNQENESND